MNTEMEDQSILVREYIPDDLEQVLDLVKEMEAELAEKFPKVQIKSGIEDYCNRYLKMGNKYKTFVAEIDSRIVGFLMGYPSLGTPEVDTMYDILPVSKDWTTPEFYLQITYVSHDFRRRGVSRRMHQKIIQYARKQGHKEVYACIAKWNFPELKVISSLKFKKKDLGYRYRLSLKL